MNRHCSASLPVRQARQETAHKSEDFLVTWRNVSGCQNRTVEVAYKSPQVESIIVQPDRVTTRAEKARGRTLRQFSSTVMASKPITSPVPDAWYPTLAVSILAIGLLVTASFFIYETTTSRRSRSLSKELGTGAVASVFLGFGSLFLLLSCGVYV